MKFDLIKVEKTTDGGVKFYEFYIHLDNGSNVRVQPNTYVDKNGVKHSNYRELLLIATDSLPF